MKDFIDDYITSISSRRQERIYDLLDVASLGKDDLEALITKITSIKDFAILTTSKEKYGAKIDSRTFVQNFRDMNNRMSELYTLSNQISLIFSNNVDTLSSEIKAVEDELNAVEKAIDTYAFQIADGGSFDYVFTETFNDDTMSVEPALFRVPDRSGGMFELDEYAVVNGSNGILSMSSELTKEYRLFGEITKSNCMGFAEKRPGQTAQVRVRPGRGWQANIRSPKPINSTITTNSDYTGAQVMITCTLQHPSPCDTILIEPHSDIPLDVLEIKIYQSRTDETAEDILAAPKVIDRPTNFYFPNQNIYKFTIVLNQSTYKRQQIETKPSEEKHRTINETIRNKAELEKQLMGDTFLRDRRVYKYVFMKTDKYSHEYPSMFNAEVPSKKYMNIGQDPRFTFRFKPIDAADGGTWRKKNMMDTTLRKVIYDRLIPKNSPFLNDRMVTSHDDAKLGRPSKLSWGSDESSNQIGYTGGEPALDGSALLTTLVRSRKKPTYDYSLGFKSIQIGTGSGIKRGAFVTKPIPAPGDAVEIKVKATDTNYQIRNGSLDNNIATSVEYSITNKSFPKTEQDWIPILSAGTTSVVSERMFVDSTGLAKLRFKASSLGGLDIYRNGLTFDFDQETSFQYENGLITGVRLPNGSFSDDDIFTCSYTPSEDATTIKLSEYGFDQTYLTAVYDNNGPGEKFNQGSGVDKVITLSQNPFVDYDEVEDELNSSTYGTEGYSSSYQPISIILDDGTVAINQTNYLGGQQNKMSDYSDSDNVYYIHSGRDIMFNKVITNPFTVYYQYLPSNMRLRIVMRANYKTYVSPIVDTVQVKAKVKKADIRREL